MERRLFLNGALGFGAALMTGSRSRSSAAADAISQTSVEMALVNRLFPGLEPMPSPFVKLSAPFISTRGHSFLAKISCTGLPVDAAAVTIAGSEAYTVAYAKFHVPGCGFGFTMSLHRTATMNAYVMSGDRLLMTSQHIKVTRGGYGTNDFRQIGRTMRWN